MILPRRSTQVGGTPAFSAGQVAVPGNPAAEQARQLGQGIERAAGAGFDVVNQLQEEFNVARIKEADNRAADVFRDVVGRYQRTVGKDATGKGREQAFTEIEERLRGIGEKLDTQDQRDAFEEQVAARMVRARGIADAHEADQIRVDAVGQAKARQDSEMLDAVGAAGDPTQFAYHRGVMLSEVDNQADLAGMTQDDPRRALARREVLSQLHDQAVRSLVSQGRAGAARQHLEAAGDDVDPVTRGKLQGLVQQATTDEQSFGAARWVTQQHPGRLLDQIETLNQLHEADPKAFPIEARDAAEARIRSMEQVDYQVRARTGNEAVQQAQAFAGLNRIRRYEELPIDLRAALEDGGRSEPMKLWLEQGHQFITTQRGLAMLARGPELLAGRTWEDIEAGYQEDLSPDDLKALHNEWARVNKVQGVGEAMVSLTLNRRMQEQGWLPIGKDPSAEQTARRNWILESVRRRLGSGAADQATVDKAIEQELAETLIPLQKTALSDTNPAVPISALTPKEREDGYYAALNGNLVPKRQVSSDMVAQRIAENIARNQARRDANRDLPVGQQIGEFLPEDTPTIVKQLVQEASNRQLARQTAHDAALKWLVFAFKGDQGKDAWHALPDGLRQRLEETGTLEKARADFETYAATHDFLGREIQPWQANPNSAMHNFSSPWGNR